MIRNILLIIFILFATPAFSQIATVEKDSWYIIENFSKELNSHVSPYLLGNGSAQQAFNIRANDEYGALVKREKTFLLSTAPTSAVKSIYRYYKSDNTKYTVVSYSTILAYISDAGVETQLYASASDSKVWSFVTYKDILIGMNGTDNAKKWDGNLTVTANTDGSRTAGDLITDLGAPFAELNTGSNLDASSWYQYRIAYYDGSSYTYSLARSNPILTGSSVRNIYLTNIPLGPAGTTQRIIYRTVGDASRSSVTSDSSFYRVATISDNSTVVYADAITDATILGDSAPTWSTVSAGTEVTPPKSKFSLINTERLFLANDPSGTISGKSTVYWSDILNPDYFNFLVDYELVRPDDGDGITFIKDVLGILTIGKTRTISKIYTENSSSANWTVSDPFSYYGCIAPYSAVNASSGLIYLSRTGIYSYNGQNSTKISDVVTDVIRDILSTSITDTYAIFYDDMYLMAYTSEETGSSNNDRILILDVTRDAYVIDTLSVDSFANFDSGDDFGTLYSGSSESDGNIYAHQNSFNKLVYRYKSQIEDGTTSDTYIGGSEDSPTITLGSNEKWSESTDNWEDSGSKTWIVDALTGYWSSPIVQVNASQLDKIYWNESLGSSGDVSFDIRTGATTTAVMASSYSGVYTDPSGDDVSGQTADTYLQIRGTLTSTSWTETPTLFLSDSFLLRLTYKTNGTTGESNILSIWQSGITSMNAGELPKRIKEVQVYYQGSSGTLNFKYDNTENDSYNFDIDLSIDPTASSTDSYFGTNENKIFVHIPPFESVPNGRHWSFTVTENGTEKWTVHRIAIRKDVNSYTTFK